MLVTMFALQGKIQLPSICKPKLNICVLGNVKHCEEAAALGMDSIGLAELKTYKRNKKRVKELAGSYDAFLASDNLIKQIPRLLGPGLNKAGKFPTMITNEESLQSKIDGLK